MLRRLRCIFYVVVLTLIIVPLLSTANYASEDYVAVKVGKSAVIVDDLLTQVDSYVIEGATYLKLTDIAYLLSNSKMAFNIQWDSETKVTQLIKRDGYIHDWDDDNLPRDQTRKAIPNEMSVNINGQNYLLQSYLIEGRNHIKMKDVATLLGYQINWDASTSTIHITDPQNPKTLKFTDIGENTSTTLTATDYTIHFGAQPQKGVYKIGDRFYYAFCNTGFDIRYSSLFSYLYIDPHVYLKCEPTELREVETVLESPVSVTDHQTVGTIKPMKRYLTLSVESDEIHFKNALYELGDQLILIDLEAFKSITSVRYDHTKKTINLFEDMLPEKTPAIEKDLVNEALKTLALSGKTPKQKLELIHDYIVRTLEYNTNYFTYDTADAIRTEQAIASANQKYTYGNNITLSAKTGVCQDYATLLHEMCIRAGIPSTLQYGIAASDTHLWNRVFYDGKWRFVDVTWDDPLPNVKNPKSISRRYFDILAKSLTQTHYWNGADYNMPEYQPDWQQMIGKTAQTQEDFIKILIANMKNQTPSFVVKVKNGSAYGGLGPLYFYSDRGIINYFTVRGSYEQSVGGYRFYVEY